jgi:hypothetical protein
MQSTHRNEVKVVGSVSDTSRYFRTVLKITRQARNLFLLTWGGRCSWYLHVRGTCMFVVPACSLQKQESCDSERYCDWLAVFTAPVWTVDKLVKFVTVITLLLRTVDRWPRAVEAR